MLQEMQKRFLIFPKLLDFRAFFEKSVFLENGHDRHQMGAMLIHYTFIFSEYQLITPHESFIQKYWQVSKLPIFQNHIFLNSPKSPNNFKKFDFKSLFCGTHCFQ